MSDELKDGEQIDYYENGQIHIKFNYNAGKREGEQLSYYENGQLESKGNYKEDKKDAEWLMYYENGQLQIKSNWKEGIQDGDYLCYYEKYNTSPYPGLVLFEYKRSIKHSENSIRINKNP